MTYDILATGSSGNAVVINGEILIDIGVPYKTLERSGYIPGLRLVLLTHAHSDHFKPATARRLHQERPALRWGCCEWMVMPLLEAGVDKRVIDVYQENGLFIYFGGLLHIQSIPTYHDVSNCAYKIFSASLNNVGGCRLEKLFYATDTGTLEGIEARNYDLYLIEANHTEAEIAARTEEKLAKGEFAYEFRAARNHLSQEQAEKWLAANAGPNSEKLFLHQHKEKNHA